MTARRTVERALALSTRRRLRRDRRRVQRRQPALGRQHPDHQRRDALAARHGHRHRRRRTTGMVSRAGVTPGQVEDLVRAAERAAGTRGPAEDAGPLSTPRGGHGRRRGTSRRPRRRSACSRLRARARRGVRRRAATARALFGYAEHELNSTYLGTSDRAAAAARPADRPVELNGKSADLARSTWAGVGTRDFRDVDVDRPRRRARHAAQLGRAPVELPAGRYETLLPPSAVADLMVYLYWSPRRARRRTTAARCSAAPAAAPGSATRSPSSR